MPGMLVRSFRRTFIATAVIVASHVAITPAYAGLEGQIEDAARLVNEGELIRAKDALFRLQRDATTTEDRERIHALISTTEERLNHMSRAEISLQKAELALDEGDLRSASRQANAAMRADRASVVVKQEASDLLDVIAAKRVELEPLAQPMLAQAIEAFNNEDYAGAKAGFMAVKRLDVDLPQADLAALNRYQTRIYELERQNGEPFESEQISFGVLSGAAQAVAAAGPIGFQPEPEPVAEPMTDEPETVADPAPTQAAGDDLFAQLQKIEAERLMSEGDIAYEQGLYAEAAQKYQQLVTTLAGQLTAEELAYAKDKLAEASALVGGRDIGLIDREIRNRTILREQALTEKQGFVARAEDALGRGNTAEARNLFAQARLTINNANANGLLSESEYRQLSRDLDGLGVRIENTEESMRITEINRQADQVRREAEQARVREERERDEKINESLDRLRALQRELKYEEALQVAEQILFLDPNNPAALLMKDVLEDLTFYRQWEETQSRRFNSYGKETIERNRILEIPDSLMEFPPDWPELSWRRGMETAFLESETDRRVLATLETTRIPGQFDGNRLEDVLTFIGTVTNLNLDVDWDSLSLLGIDEDTEVDLNLREVPARVVLDRVLEKVSPDEFSLASWAVDDGILVISSDSTLRRNTFIVIYDVNDLLFEIPDYEEVPSLDLDQILNQSQQGGGGGGGSIFENEDVGDAEGLTREEIVERLRDIITSNVDPDGWIDTGGDTGSITEINGNLIITNTARNHREIQGLLSQLREIRSIQISVEARFLQVSQEFFEQIGFDLDVYFNADNGQFNAAANQQRDLFGVGTLGFGGGNSGLSLLPSDIAAATDFTGGAPSRVVSTPGYFIQDDGDGDPTTFLAVFDNTPAAVTAPDPLSVVPVQSGSDVISEALITGSSFAAEVLDLNPALSVLGTFLDDVQVDFLVQATQADRRNVVLTAPRLTFTNGKTANIINITQEAFVSDLAPITGTGSVAFDPTIGVVGTGFTMSLSGVVSADRRYVTLAINAGIAVRREFGTGTVSAVAAGQGGLQGAVAVPVESTFQLPVIDITQINTGATIPDKGTLLIGGQRLVTEIEVESGVPVLSKLPILNRFFSNRITSREDQTLLILMKPTVIIQSEEEELNYPGLADQLSNPFR